VSQRWDFISHSYGGRGASEYRIISINLAVTSSSGFQRLDPPRLIYSRDSSCSNNNMIAINLLLNAKNVGFSFNKLGRCFRGV
jgi:hypothetical protein